jgi:hypothetical protein
MKLLNEIFVAGDDQWQESVKTYVISLFLADIASSVEMQKCLLGVACGPGEGEFMR